MADVFISYKSERRNAAQHLKQIFELNGYTVWFDYGLLTGRDFARQIEKELTAAKAVVVLWCSRSVQSKWVIDEAFFAQENGKYIPVWIEKIALPFGFQRDDTINLADWDAAPRSPDLDRLFDQIAHLVSRAPTPNYHGLRQHEANWKMFGAPRLADFALDKDLELERARREEEESRFAEVERQRKDEEDARREAEQKARAQREAEQQCNENEELERLTAAKLQAEAEKRAKQAQQRETELQAQKVEKLARKQQAEAELKRAEARQIIDDARTQSTIKAIENADEVPSSIEVGPAAIPKANWISSPAIRYVALAIALIGGLAAFGFVTGIWENQGAGNVGSSAVSSNSTPPMPADLRGLSQADWTMATNGLAPYQAIVGVSYLTGKDGTTKDGEKAEYWLLKAANQGQIDAQRYLGLLYYVGVPGFPAKVEKAEQWLLKAANQNNVDAMYELGAMYSNAKTQGGQSKSTESVFWLKKAAALNHPEAIATLRRAGVKFP